MLHGYRATVSNKGSDGGQQRLIDARGPGGLPAALVIAILAAAAAGFVDAYLFRHVARVFVANMSGNLIHLGMDLGVGDMRGVGLAATALGAFLLGVMLSTRWQARRSRAVGVVTPSALLVVESLLIVGLLVLISSVDLRPSGAAPLIHVAVAVGAVAMGLQAATLRAVGHVAVATTYGSGTIVGIGQGLASGAGGAGRSRLSNLQVLSAVIAGYVGGAALSAALGSSPWLLMVPASTLLLCAAAARLAAVELFAPTGAAHPDV